MTSNIDASLLRQSKDFYGSEYEKHLIEQYKIYVEMADRISSRRMLANSFFVGVHTALIASFTVLLKEKILSPDLIGVIPFFAVILLCFVWWRTVKSYRQLNSGKFQVVHAMEKMLPLAPFDAEWEALGRGENRSIYLPLTHTENYIPICFGILYGLLGLNLYLKG